MKKVVARALIPVLAAGGIAIGSVMAAAPASAGCQGAWTPWGGGETCDGPIGPDGWFQRCVSGGGWGFGGGQCYPVDVNNMAGQHIPWHIG